MKNYFNLLLYFSFAFLIAALIKADYLIIPTIYSWTMIVLSILLVFAGFVYDALSWQITLEKGGQNISFNDGIISSGLSVFTKYIPGKLWVILGRSAFISKRYNLSNIETSTASLQAQLIALWAGMLVSIPGLIGFNLNARGGIKYWLIAMIIFSILISFN